MPSQPHGLHFQRSFCPEGIDPYDTVEWESRTAQIKNDAGETIFIQEGVEFPSTWSMLSTNVVASKYFYGDIHAGNGSPADGKREYSVRQLVHRIANTVTQWGLRQGYFAGKHSADEYYADLVWLLLHQHGAFNSPVNFNTGIGHEYGIREKGEKEIYWYNPDTGKSEPVDSYLHYQASACFIIPSKDSISEIWDSYKTSAILFKYGSGVGSDWSSLRSTKEKLSGGGTPSGPVSFMKVQDATGGTIKSGGKTRRAAIMQTLKSWHPDVREFITAKQEEEKKAWALIEQGYDGSFNGPAYGSVGFQNVNQSVRLTDEFMQAATAETEEGQIYPLRAVTTGEVVDRDNARDLLMLVAEGTHICGDPGVQYEDTIQDWHTAKEDGDQNSSNPCSEYLYLDNTACNLASLNLRRFQNDDGTLQKERLAEASERFALAQEILVGQAGYPSPEIAELSYKHRTIGQGFANLGAFLMVAGLPYDSPEGRWYAGLIMSIINASCYRMSAAVAKEIGPFERFEDNAEHMIRVLHKHANHTSELVQQIERKRNPATDRLHFMDVADFADDRNSDMVQLAKMHGVRNAQATVLAPTGTIAFLMDCDTTGIEPDIAVVKYKLLAGKGDGMLKIVNQSVPLALKNLGYSEREVKALMDWIDRNDTIEGAPALNEEHLPVFDCAFKPANGVRSIGVGGHLQMMAACQPFVSGAISKTVNLPETATVQDIFDTYVEGWKLGLKAVAIYRDNSKRSQPLSTSKGGNTRQGQKKLETLDDILAEIGEERFAAAVKKIGESIAPAPVSAETRSITRRRLKDEVTTVRKSVQIGAEKMYLHIGLFEDGQPGEVFITMDKQGSTLAGFADAFAKLLSITLQWGVPLDELVDTFEGTRFAPEGFTGSDPYKKYASSPVDYLFTYLAKRFLGAETKTEEFEEAAQESALPMVVTPTGIGFQIPSVSSDSGPSRCPRCSAPAMIPNGACEACSNCGYQGGCG